MNKFVSFMKTSIYDPFVRSFFRFTETFVTSVIIVVLTILNNEWWREPDIVGPILRTLWLLMPLLVLAKLVFERFRLKHFWRYVFSGAALALAVIYYFVRPLEPSSFIENLRYFMLIIMSALLAVCFPYFRNRDGFPIYVMHIASKLFATIFYAGVLYGSIVAILASIEALFAVNLGTFVYINFLIAVVGIVAIPIFLGFIPLQDKELTIADYNRIWKTVFSFIVLPVVIIFAVILFIYLVTSTINQNYYPDIFLLASLGVGFAGIATIFALEPFAKDTPHIAFFTKYWPYLMAVVTIGIFVETIRQMIIAGLSMGNVIYLYLALWLAVILVLLIIRKSIFKFSFGQTFFLSLTDILFIATIFPFANAVNIATYYHNHELTVVLEKYDMLEGDVIVPRTDLPEEARIEIVGVIFAAEEIGYSRLRLLPADFSWMDFETVFGFEYIIDPGIIDDYVYVNWRMEEYALDLGSFPAFDYLLDVPFIIDQDIGACSLEENAFVWTLSGPDFSFNVPFLEIVQELNARLPYPDGVHPLLDMAYDGTSAGVAYTIYPRLISGALYATPASFELGSAHLIIGIDVI